MNLVDLKKERKKFHFFLKIRALEKMLDPPLSRSIKFFHVLMKEFDFFLIVQLLWFVIVPTTEKGTV